MYLRYTYIILYNAENKVLHEFLLTYQKTNLNDIFWTYYMVCFLIFTLPIVVRIITSRVSWILNTWILIFFYEILLMKWITSFCILHCIKSYLEFYTCQNFQASKYIKIYSSTWKSVTQSKHYTSPFCQNKTICYIKTLKILNFKECYH